MTLFAQLKEWSDDQPQGLAELAATDASVEGLCFELGLAAHLLQVNERRKRALFSAPVAPNFLAAWRDYEHRYEAVVRDIFFGDMVKEQRASQSLNTPKADLEWADRDAQGEGEAVGIGDAIEFARHYAEDENRWLASEEKFIQGINDGIAAFERLTGETGFDLRGVFRRRALVPFVLVPREVAARHGSTEKLSMLTNLQQAHDAFVYGATYGALALMRSIMEAVLRDHYGAEGADLDERIRNVRGRLPQGANEAALHRLRKLANAVLHLDRERDEGLSKMDDERLEKEIVSLLFALRALIEGVK